MSKSDTVRMRHMRDAALEARYFVSGRSRADLEGDRLLGLGLVRLLEIVGEAARHVTEPTRQKYPNVPWLNISDMRNRLIHGYSDIDLDIVWNAIAVHLPPLIRELELALAIEEG